MEHRNAFTRWISEISPADWAAIAVITLFVLNSHAFFRAALDLWEWLGW